MDSHPAAPQHAVPVAETVPFAGDNVELDVGTDRPTITDLDQHRSPLPQPGCHATGISLTNPMPGSDDDDIDGTDKGGEGRRPCVGFGPDEQQAFERNAELTDRRQPKIGLSNDGSPRPGL